ncbi:MAG: Rossmann-like and DUF2520 domain-containing protein [Pelovirga sp.]
MRNGGVKPSVALIGPGRVGCVIARALHRAGYALCAVIGTQHQSASAACRFIGCSEQLASTDLGAAAPAGLVLLAVPDDLIAPTAHSLQKKVCLAPATTLLHFSGVHPAAVMRYPGAAVTLFSLHPLLPFADRDKAFARLSLAAYAGEGDAAATALAEELVTVLGGTFWLLAAEHKPLYHAAACVASNYLVTLVSAAGQLLSACGIPAQAAPQLLAPLLQATLENILSQGVEEALTGPIVRGDTGTLARHLAALELQAPELREFYCRLGEKTVQLARAAGRLNQAAGNEILTLLQPGGTPASDKMKSKQ